MSKKFLLSVSIKECEVQTFRAGGKGGQNQNKRDSGVRVIHRASGARGEARDHRTQLQNKKAAFRRMSETKEFKNWLKIESSRKMGEKSVEEIVEDSIKSENLKIETKDENGNWVVYKKS